MRLYHRRSSSTKYKPSSSQLLNMTAVVNPRLQNLQALGARGHRSSLGSLGTVPVPQRPRSQSLCPGSSASNCLTLPQRSRSGSFSGDLSLRSPVPSVQTVLTASEEEHIFRCYVRVMYMVLGMLGAAIFGLVLYAFHNSVISPRF